ncbi:serine/threonine-protein phosphatase 6 regulatory subunit 3-like isoform X2 [Brienomyrus brachyistius]|uniref:serine/threonine-protein phosphatase 6 regulatory subunit 3-like isoform X2 n=1 Tax=Brienomyrus brachyistius TaxID=42636 RepID=UPI0020B3CA49|nr:serine/threonine-protein phosphatase 6 regulatory subunit 3-like isoform X2 [Brienomyrus brachyistius]
MFWRFDLYTTSHIDALLEKGNVTLIELMDEEDVLQECKAQNRQLIDFLVQPQSMEDLVGYVTQEPSDDMDEKLKYKFPNISCELLTSDVSRINDKLGEDESLLTKLYSFLQHDPPLNPLLASFFSKVLSILIRRKPDQIVEFLRKRDDFVDLMIRHIGTSAIMDLMLRMLTCIHPEQLRQDVLNWLNEEKVIQRLVDMVQPTLDEDKHSNASQLLCEIIHLSRDQMFQVQGGSESDPLLVTLEKQETVGQLLSNNFDKERNDSAIVSVIQILLTLFEMRKPAFEGHLESCPPNMNHPSFSVSPTVLEAVKPRLKDFHQLLLEPPEKNVLKTTWGVLDPPVGNARLHVVRLVASLLQTNTHTINLELIDLNTVGVILDMYFKYIWNNFLHIQVEICIAMILTLPPTQSASPIINGDNDSESVRENLLVQHLFQKCQLLQRILDAWVSNEKEQAEGGRRRGYMGHLTRIANSVVHNSDKGPNSMLIQQLISELPEDVRDAWDAFISGQLADINKKNTVDLINTHIHPSSNDEVDFKSTGFRQDSALQQAFSDYQMQQMTSNFIEQFGFNDEGSAEQDDVVDIAFDRISDINFSLNTNESANIALFEAFCKEKIQECEDAGSDEDDIWDEKDVTFAPETQRRPSSGSTGSEESTDSEEEDGKRDPFEPSNTSSDDRMEVNSAWTSSFDIPMEIGCSTGTGPPTAVDASQTLMPKSVGCSSENSSQGKKDGWADFSNFPGSVSPNNPLRSCSPVAMETSSEDPLTAGFAAQSEAEVEQWPGQESQPATMVGEEEEEEDEELTTDRVTDTVANGSMKETVSLTVDAKTETAVFKRVLKSFCEDKSPTSGDPSTKYAVTEDAVLVRTESSPPASNSQQHRPDKQVQAPEAVNGPA